ncbi:YoaK family protein [Adhaeribacter terreus]|uniref:YoaK family protein n=1 Tax=Adhaeribacter terreus TaxID=529703 RepID=A0ABW0ECW8_9BACT
MFRHVGKGRTLVHNLQLASLLSLVAGIVNVSGIFALQTLTTNVTGHFAYFADEIAQNHFAQAWVFLLYIIAFLFGAFSSNFFIEFTSRHDFKFGAALPISIEVFILTAIAFLGPETVKANGNLIACGLLYAMGLQNALVTSLSNSVVRTTHLTGLFTDLGIELSKVIFRREYSEQKQLISSIKLRLTIIAFFFSGCIVGGLVYFFQGMLSLLLAAGILVMGWVYAYIKFQILMMKRKLHH